MIKRIIEFFKSLFKNKVNEPIDYISNGSFTEWPEDILTVISEHQDVTVIPNWRIKTKDGIVKAACTQVNNGMAVLGVFGTPLSYLYIRQLVPNVRRFSKKSYVMSVNLTTATPLSYDVYVTARYNEDDNSRTKVIDTETYSLQPGKYTLEIPFTVPELRSDVVINSKNCLSVAFRIVGKSEVIRATIHSIKILDKD